MSSPTNNSTQSAAEVLSRDEAAAYLRVSPATLNNWAARGLGPRYSRSGAVRGRTLYRLADLRDWLHRRSVTGMRETR